MAAGSLLKKAVVKGVALSTYLSAVNQKCLFAAQLLASVNEKKAIRLWP